MILGPDAEDKSWIEATSKFSQRAHAWTEQNIGFHCTAISYNIFAMSVLTYLAQLNTPPDSALEAEQTALRTIAPGPHNWITCDDLWWLKDLTGHACSIASLSLASQAAQARVRVWDLACADHPPDPGTPLELPTGGHVPRTQRQSVGSYHGIRIPNNLSMDSIFHKRASHLQSLMDAPELPYTRAI